MTSEEIKALGLREEGSGGDIYDVTIRCHVSRHAGSEDYIQAEVGEGVIHKSVITAMERVRPPLPDGWAWKPTIPGESARVENGFLHARISDRGGIDGWNDAEDRPAPVEALVAKALIEAWERTQ